MKLCNVCKERERVYYSVFCRFCRNKLIKEKRERMGAGVYARRLKANFLKRVYGITYRQFIALLVKQDFRCAICLKEYPWFGVKESLHVDHDHKTGKVRGLLCPVCNRGIGMFHDDVELLKRVIEYLLL